MITRILTLIALTLIMTSSAFAQHEIYSGPQCMSNCPGDVGPKADVAAVRAAMLHEMHGTHLMLGHIDGVHVAGDYALVTEGNPGEPAMFVFRRVAAEQWKTDDQPGVEGMKALLATVPAPVAHKLCAGKWPNMTTAQGTHSTSPCLSL